MNVNPEAYGLDIVQAFAVNLWTEHGILRVEAFLQLIKLRRAASDPFFASLNLVLIHERMRAQKK